jgi:hypothetical protein
MRAETGASKNLYSHDIDGVEFRQVSFGPRLAAEADPRPK